MLESAPVPWLPERAFDPLQLPDAEQLVAPVEDHVSVELPERTTLVGDAPSCTVGAAIVPLLPLDGKTTDFVCQPSPPPFDASHVVTSPPPCAPVQVPTNPLVGIPVFVVHFDPEHWLTSRFPGEPDGQ